MPTKQISGLVKSHHGKLWDLIVCRVPFLLLLRYTQLLLFHPQKAIFISFWLTGGLINKRQQLLKDNGAQDQRIGPKIIKQIQISPLEDEGSYWTTLGG